MQRKSFLVASACAALTACGHRSAGTARFQEIAGSGEPLKTAFNRGAENVRILMLVSPT